MRSTLIIGNWKMNGKSRNLAEVDKLLDGLNGQSCDLVLCPPATLISQMAAAVKGSPIQVGGRTAIGIQWDPTLATYRRK